MTTISKNTGACGMTYESALNLSRTDLYDMYTKAAGKSSCEIPTITCLAPSFKQKYPHFKISLIARMKENIVNSNKILIDKIKIIEDAAKDEWGCGICKNRIRNLCKYVYIDELGEFMPIVYNRINELATYISSIQLHINKLCADLIKTYIEICGDKTTWVFDIATEDNLYTNLPCENRNPDSNVIYKHIYYVPENVVASKVYDQYPIYSLLQLTFNKYYPLIHSLLDKTNPDEEMLESMNLLHDLLSKAVYGKEQLHATKWFISIIEKILFFNKKWSYLSPTNKIQIICDTIADSSISKGENKDGFIGTFHTVNNYLLGILEKGESPQAVIKMIEKRNDPNKFKKKTAEPKQAHIEKAMALCSNMVNTIHTVDEISNFPTCYAITRKNEDINEYGEDAQIGNAFAAMSHAASMKKKAANKYSMSSRFNSKGMSNSEFEKPTTLIELLHLINNGVITSLQIINDNRCGNPVYTAKTTLDPNDIAYKNVGHFWAYLNNERPNQRWVYSKNLDISHIYLIKAGTRENYIFVVKNSRDTLVNKPINTNCTFPEFLASHHHSAKAAFGKLEKTTKVRIPDEGELAFGIGTSVTKPNGEIYSHNTFIINNKHTVTINRAWTSKSTCDPPVKY